MPFGIVSSSPSSLTTKANFYIPIITDATVDAPLSCSHVYYNSPKNIDEIQAHLDTLGVPPEVKVLVDCPPHQDITAFFMSLTQSPRDFVIVTPVHDNLEYWYALRDLPAAGPQIVLHYTIPVPDHILKRYKCLTYLAVLASSSAFANGMLLLEKAARPALLLTAELALQHSYSFWHGLASPKLLLYSDQLTEPLQPLSTEMELSVYETFEKDTVKYVQYENAISMAIDDLHAVKEAVKILVIGPGRGPLLEMASKHCRDLDSITAVEKNSKCIGTLRERFRHSSIELIHGDVRDIPNASSYHLVISELLGSWGCNEAFPEILSIFTGSEAIFIPQEVTNYIQPIFTDIAMYSRPMSVAKLNSFYGLHEPKETFSYRIPGEIKLSRTESLYFKGSAREKASALYGFFDAILYGPYRISIRSDSSPWEFCSSWYPMVFPIADTPFPLHVCFERRSSKALSYRWTVNGEQYGDGSSIELD